MVVFEVNPLSDPRWDSFLESHPSASIFHTKGWLESLHKTYGYIPVVYTTASPDERITNGIPFCKIWCNFFNYHLTSIPFCDHSSLLVDGDKDLSEILNTIENSRVRNRIRFIEIRPCNVDQNVLEKCTSFRLFKTYYLHTLDLQADLDTIYRGLHKKSIQQTLGRAVRENIECINGNSVKLLEDFFGLFVRTRRKHGIPPPPEKWFQNLVQFLGTRVKIHVAYKNNIPIASILTLHYKQTFYYKYSCSNEKYSNLGGTQLLLWNCIKEAKRLGAQSLDMGRSEYDNQGLLVFKRRWGCCESKLLYFRSPWLANDTRSTGHKVIKSLLERLPLPLLVLMGKHTYKYFG